MEATTLRDYATDAAKLWEPGRVLYNVVLTTIVLIYFAVGYPTSRRSLSLDFCLALFLLAVVANVAYCTAYIVDLFVQSPGFRGLWQRYRWLLFAIGTTCGAVITHRRGTVQKLLRPTRWRVS